MQKILDRVGQIVLAVVICVAMLLPSISYYHADEVVFDSKEELFSAMRKAILPRESVDMEFAITDRLRDEICYYDELFHQHFLKDSNYGYIIFDFNGDQMGIPANEGDYLQQNLVGFFSIGDISSGSWGTTINIKTSNYMTTAAQENEFENKLKSLFTSGGALEYTKTLSKAEAVVAYMDYINKNVKSISSIQGVDHTAYGALCKGQATCQGKALLLYRLLREIGISNRVLMGIDAGAHTYNIVMIDGKYYYCDPSTTTVILKGSNSFTPATLQDHYQTDEFKSGVLSKISTTDYPLKTSDNNSQSGNSTQAGSGSQANSGSQSGNSTQAGSGSQSNSGSQSGNSTQAGSGSQSNSGSQSGSSSQSGSATQQPEAHKHSYAKTYSTDKTNHWYACTCGDVKDKEKHSAGEWIVDKAATSDVVGSQSKKCTKCGYLMETQEIPKLGSVEYEVLDGAESIYQQDTKEFSLRAAGEIDKFVNVEVDGQIVDPKYYTVKEGSTIIIFTKEFMDMLGEGEHVVKFNFTDGTASTNIKVATKTPEISSTEDTTESTEDISKNESTEDKQDANIQKKDDGVSPVVWVVLVILILAGGAAGVIWYRKKNMPESEE